MARWLRVAVSLGLGVRQGSGTRENWISTTIPKVVWQGWITKELPPAIAAVNTEMRKGNPGWKFILMDRMEQDQFMRDFYDGPIAQAYFSLNQALGAARADLFRYCLLFRFGGVWCDIDTTINQPLDAWLQRTDSSVFANERHPFPDNSDEAVTMRRLLQMEIQPTPPGLSNQSVVQWMLVQAPGSPFLRAMIDHCTAAIHAWVDVPESKRIPIATKIHQITGPGAWTNVVRGVINRYQPSSSGLNFRFAAIDFGDAVTFKFVPPEGKYRHYFRLRERRRKEGRLEDGAVDLIPYRFLDDDVPLKATPSGGEDNCSSTAAQCPAPETHTVL